MKKLLVTIFVIFNFVNLFANEGFEYAKAVSESEFEELNKIENYLESHPQATFEVIKTENPDLLANLKLHDKAEPESVVLAKDMPLVGGFWWGCCLGIIGLALVYFITDNDREQVKKALIGCLIATLVWSIGGLWNPFSW
jgi:hypothetical protein